MAVQLNDSSEVLECCLHGKACREGQRRKNKDSVKTPAKTDQYANLAVSKSQARGSSIQDEVIDRLARQLRKAEEFNKKRDQRREERRRRRAERAQREEEQSESKKAWSSSVNSDISYRQLDGYEGLQKVRENSGICGSTGVVKDSSHSGGACCKLNESVSVSMTTTPKKKSKEDDSSTLEPSDSVKKKAQLTYFSKGDEVDNRGDYIARTIYLGVCNFAKAEEMVQKRADFRLYHELLQNPYLDDLEPELPLYLVYKTGNGSYRHYLIRTRKVDESTYYYVDTGEKRPIYHCNLNHLVKFYQINAQRHPDHKEYAEPFSWWKVST
ncbi:hypothetical protein Q1695_008572 [Nippostrongylus brasiliensis]|nr:hypothetical protein Q1695_008572 [Nippostrongylus brasiliensis]